MTTKVDAKFNDRGREWICVLVLIDDSATQREFLRGPRILPVSFPRPAAHFARMRKKAADHEPARS